MLWGAIFWMAFAFVLAFIWENRRVNTASSKSENILRGAESTKKQLLGEAKAEAESMTQRAEKFEQRMLEREKKAEIKLQQVEDKYHSVSQKEDEIQQYKEKLVKKSNELDGKLSEIAKLSEQQARELFMEQIKEKYSDDGVEMIRKFKKKTDESKKEAAREIILKSIQQYAGDVTSEVTTTLITLPSDDIKGKLIGKEGRNITAFEKAAGVALIIDDTPGSVFISAFDLYRRYVAKKSLEKLIEDGRIQPARIEEVVRNTESEAELLLKELGNKVVDELEIRNIPEDLMPIIGKLRFRTSYGQNIIKHSKEVALIAESLARDLWADPELCKAGWLLHDIGKALDQEIEGTHPEIGGKVGRRYKLNPKIVDMIENHHGEQFEISLEAAIVQVADAISSVRPWARREVIEDYMKRVQEMEALAASFPWVNKAYALSAGREVRVFLDAESISDIQAHEMAKSIAENIQEKLSYPGEVKINVIREMRVIEYAK